MSTYLVAIVVGEFEYIEQTIQQVCVHTYYIDGTTMEGLCVYTYCVQGTYICIHV